MSDLEVEIIRARAHYAANRIIEDGVPFEDSHEDFDELIAQVRKEAKAEALRDVEASLINWDVLRGDEQGTAEDHESNRIATWIGRRADRIANKEGDIA